ncbi:GtrA family protein [Streptomyces aureoverticillatus]|uniref:GtrA family protein n=1 Tax=Streptomyces aureoverticillatus TaxID=66871 RepID=UPI0013DB11D4|nr:GtrA family protein [Streptomyces aureoverticillatus]QIB45460.1 GtrA family protein [Streptomyces aureoverticillatus]
MTSTLHEVPAATAGVAGPAPAPRLSLARLRRLCLELAKFGVVGGSGVAVNLVVFNLLLHGLSSAPMTATVLASCVAMGTNYLGFRFFAYRDRASRTKRQIALFFVFSGIGVVMESLLFYAAYHGAGLSGPLGSNIAKAQSIVLASAFRFLVYRTWVFQHRAHHGGLDDVRHDARRA